MNTEYMYRTLTLQEILEGVGNYLEVNTSWQREFVWKPAKQKKLLDSLLDGIPIAPVQLVQCREGGKDILCALDGKQRLTSLHSFLKPNKANKSNKISLPNTEGVKRFLSDDSVGKTFSQLSKKHQMKILNRTIPAMVLTKRDGKSFDLHNPKDHAFVIESFLRAQQGESLSETEKLYGYENCIERIAAVQMTDKRIYDYKKRCYVENNDVLPIFNRIKFKFPERKQSMGMALRFVLSEKFGLVNLNYNHIVDLMEDLRGNSDVGDYPKTSKVKHCRMARSYLKEMGEVLAYGVDVLENDTLVNIYSNETMLISLYSLHKRLRLRDRRRMSESFKKDFCEFVLYFNQEVNQSASKIKSLMSNITSFLKGEFQIKREKTKDVERLDDLNSFKNNTSRHHTAKNIEERDLVIYNEWLLWKSSVKTKKVACQKKK